MIKHPHHIRRITSRTVNGRAVLKASILEEDGIFTATVWDVYGVQYGSGSNNRDLTKERAVLRSMLDPVRA